MMDNQGTTIISNDRFLELIEVEKAMKENRIVIKSCLLVGFDEVTYITETEAIKKLTEKLNKSLETIEQLREEKLTKDFIIRNLEAKPKEKKKYFFNLFK